VILSSIINNKFRHDIQSYDWCSEGFKRIHQSETEVDDVCKNARVLETSKYAFLSLQLMYCLYSRYDKMD